jgi:hypothetical protein
MWTISTWSFGWRSNTPEPIIRAAVTVEFEGTAHCLVEAVLHQRLVPERHHGRVNVDHEVVRLRVLPQPFGLGAVEEDAGLGCLS